jgi:uncharacterized protein YkwD
MKCNCKRCRNGRNAKKAAGVTIAVVIVAVAVLVAFPSSLPSNPISNVGAAVTLKPLDASKTEAYIYGQVNEEREKAGLRQLVFDPEISDVARAHSADMLDRDYYDHVSPEGADPSDRVRTARICIGASENIYKMSTSNTGHSEEGVAEFAMNGWMESPGHRENILDRTVSRIGVGVVFGNDGTILATQNFC